MAGKRFNQLLSEHRKAAGLTQRQLAELLETSETTIVAYEKGRRCPDERTLRKIVQELGLQGNDEALRELERKGMYTPMILDIPPAETELVLAEDSTSVHRKKRKGL